MVKEWVIIFASLGFSVFSKYPTVLKEIRTGVFGNRTAEQRFTDKTENKFCPVSGSKQNCHSLPCCMIFEIYKLVEKTAKNPTSTPHLLVFS